MEDYPYVSSFKDKYGVTRYRFRRGGKSFYLEGEPGEPQFEDEYQAAIMGQEKSRNVTGLVPGSFADAWRLVRKSAEWKVLRAATKLKNKRLSETFLRTRIIPDEPDTWGDMQVKELKRRHVRMILSDHSETPHKAKHLLTAIRRMIGEALDQDWIEYDPSQKIRWRPEYTGWRAWTMEERARFEKRWGNGTTPRAAYAMALWLGNRRSDVATQRWEDVDFENKRVTVRQIKGGKTLRLLMLPMLEEALSPLPRKTDTVLCTAYGKPFSEKSLTGKMADWTKAAGIGGGCTLHGLRKTLGKYLAEEGATSKQAAGILGHDDLDHVELYSREADQERLAVDGMSKLLKYRV